MIVLNALLPVILVIGLGYFFKHSNFLNNDFWTMAEKLSYFVLLPLLLFLLGVARDRDLMGEWVASRRAVVAYAITITVVGACVLGLLITLLI